MQGRITEKELPLAEECFPGICELYRALADKPRTFLQLLWIYEEACEHRQPAPRPRRKTARAARAVAVAAR